MKEETTELLDDTLVENVLKDMSDNDDTVFRFVILNKLFIINLDISEDESTVTITKVKVEKLNNNKEYGEFNDTDILNEHYLNEILRDNYKKLKELHFTDKVLRYIKKL